MLQTGRQFCQRPGDIAPTSFLSHAEAPPCAEDIRRVLKQALMPPWKPVEGHGRFRGAFGPTDGERAAILVRVQDGAPEGDPTD